MKRRRIIGAAGASQPDSFITLTQAGDEFSEIQRKMRNLRRSLARNDYPLEWVWIVECNEQHDQHHVHALAHGTRPEPWTLTEYAERAGFGSECSIEPESNPTQRARYLWSHRKRRALDLPHFLLMNGERFQHSTRGFWRVNGEPVGGMDAAIRMLRETT